jgi:hypothetical protein
VSAAARLPQSEADVRPRWEAGVRSSEAADRQWGAVVSRWEVGGRWRAGGAGWREVGSLAEDPTRPRKEVAGSLWRELPRPALVLWGCQLLN